MRIFGCVMLAALWASAFQRPLEHAGDLWTEVQRGGVDILDAAFVQVAATGNVSVSSCGCPRLSYSLRKKVAAATEADARRALTRLDVRSRRQGPTVHVEAQGPVDAVLSEMRLEVPRGVRQIQVETIAGSLDLQNITSDLRAFTRSGAISGGNLNGRLYARTGAGIIRIGTVGSDATLESGGGEIWVERAGGVLQATTQAGNIEIRRAAGAVTASTRGGIVTVHEAGGTVTANSGGGAVQVAAARGVQCEVLSGGIRLSDVSGELRAITGLGNIIASLAATALLGQSIISTSSGDITILIPSNLAVTVEAVNDSPAFSGRIVSEFPQIPVRQRTGAHRMIAAGALNGGGPVLRVAAAEGTIYLRQK